MLYHQGITLNDSHSLGSCRIQEGSEVASASLWNIQLYKNNSRFIYKHIEGSKALMPPHVWDIRCGLHRLFTVISNNQIDIMQIRGDIQLIPSIGLFGAASECFLCYHKEEIVTQSIQCPL